MRIEIAVKLDVRRISEIAETRGGIMPDWIDKLAEKDRAQAERRQTQEELRLHNAKVIRAKASEWWDAVIERLQADCSKLRETFPQDQHRQCNLINNGMDWELSGCKLPWKILNLRLNVDGQSVDIVESIREARDRTAPVGRDAIKIGVRSDEWMEFTFKGRAYQTPESLAQALILYVCGNTG